MRDCGNMDVRDQLPLLAQGTLDEGDRGVVLEHVAGCDACSTELQLIERVRASMHGPGAVDIERVSEVVQRATHMRGLQRSTGGRRTPGWSLAAAAAILLMAGGVLGRQAGRDGHTAAVIPVADVALPLDAQVALASDAQLEALLNDLDRIPATLAAEPDTPLSLGATAGDME